MKLFDTHAHLNIKPLEQDIDSIHQQCIEQNIYVNIVGIDLESSIKAIEQANKYKNFYAIIGIHPSDINEKTFEDEFNKIIELSKQNKVVGIGETGLDYYHDKGQNKNNQIKCFIKFIELSKNLDKTLVVHVRDAHEDAIEILKKYKDKNQRVIIHCFSGEKKHLDEYLKLGCYISISGIVTFKNAKQFQSLINEIDESKLIIETDSPFLSPEPFRGKRNSPLNIQYVFNKVAELKQNDKKELADRIFENTKKAFNIPNII